MIPTPPQHQAFACHPPRLQPDALLTATGALMRQSVRLGYVTSSAIGQDLAQARIP